MLSSYFSLNTIVELIGLVTALVCLTRDKELAWRLIVVLLAVTYVGETFGRFIYMNKIAASNHWVYNMLLFFQVGIIHIMFINLFRQYLISRWLLGAGAALICLCFGYDMLQNGFFEYSNHTYTLFCILIIIYGFRYFYKLLSDDNYVELKHFPPFWWITGILLFSFGSTACNIFYKQLDIPLLGGHHLTYYIFRILNIILYGFWSYAFICKRWLQPARNRLSTSV
jgi:hypothetical protein